MEYFLSGFVFLLIFSSIILIHEAGHFFAAKWGKMKTEEFGFGLPPRIFGIRLKKNGTLFSFNAIPFGGFVKIQGEESGGTAKDSFCNRPLSARIFTVSAGVLMNIVFGFVLLALGFMIGMKPIILQEQDFHAAVASGLIVLDDTPGVFVGGVVPGSPADKAGVQAGDFVTALDVTQVTTTQEFLDIQEKGLRGSAFHLSLTRKSAETQSFKNLILLVTPDENKKLGLYLSDTKPIVEEKEISYGFFGSLQMAGYETGRLMVFSVQMIGQMVASLLETQQIPSTIGGPVAIAQVTHLFVLDGIFAEILKLAALLSLSVAVFNIMPFPALDGGKLVLLIGELITRKKVPVAFEKGLNILGFVLLLTLIILVTRNDVLRLWQ